MLQKSMLQMRVSHFLTRTRLWLYDQGRSLSMLAGLPSKKRLLLFRFTALTLLFVLFLSLPSSSFQISQIHLAFARPGHPQMRNPRTSIVLVHGMESFNGNIFSGSGYDCNIYWGDMKTYLGGRDLRTIQYDNNDQHCTNGHGS